MTIDEAIKILQDRAIPIHQGKSKEIADAIKLGIHALYAELNRRAINPDTPILLLPGETED